MDDQKNFKLKQILGGQYNRSNGSSAVFGGSRRTGDFRLWISFTRGINATDYIILGQGLSAQSKLIYNSMNQLVKKYTGRYRPTGSQPFFDCVVFDKDAFGDFIQISSTGAFITSDGNTYLSKSAVAGLSGNQTFNTNNYIPISINAGAQSGILFPWQGVYVHFDQTNRLDGTTVVLWQPLNFKQSAMYFPRAGVKQFNFANNPSYSAASLTRTYITTVGLYGQQDAQGLNTGSSPLLAVAKITTPVKKNDETEYLFKINLEF